MDGKGRWRDNVFAERIWKSIKYEEVYLHAYASVSEARTSIGRYLEFYDVEAWSILPHLAMCLKTGFRALQKAVLRVYAVEYERVVSEPERSCSPRCLC